MQVLQTLGVAWLKKPRLEDTSGFSLRVTPCSLSPGLCSTPGTTSSLAAAREAQLNVMPGVPRPHSFARGTHTPAPSQLQKVWPGAPHPKAGSGPAPPPALAPRA